MHRALIGKVAGQRPPLAAYAQQVQHRAEHFVQIHCSGFGLAPHLLELLAADVTGVFLGSFQVIFPDGAKIVSTFSAAHPGHALQLHTGIVLLVELFARCLDDG